MAVVINVNAVQQAPNNEGTQTTTNNVIPSNASVDVGTTTKAMSIKNIASTTGLFVAGAMIKNTASLITSNVGKWSGNSHLQSQVNNGLKLGATVIGLATHPIITGIALGADFANYAVDKYITEKESSYQSYTNSLIAGTVRGRKY